MKIAKYLNKNKIGGLILIVVIVIAFGFGGFGGGFMSNNQNNIVKINKINITTQDFINYINKTGISQQVIKDNLDKDIIEELLSGLISTTLLDLEVKDFNIKFSESSLSKIIKLNDNFIDENGVFQRTKYEKFLLESNMSAPVFEQRLKKRELQKKLFDFIGAGTISPKFLVEKLFENENKKLVLDFIDLDNFYKKDNEFSDQDLVEFINKNKDKLKIEFIDFKYAEINPLNLIGVDEFNQEFFDKIDEIENNMLNGKNFNEIIKKFNLKINEINDYRYSNDSDEIIKNIFKLKNNNFDIFENNESFIIYNIESIKKKNPDINNNETKNEILRLVVQKNKFDYNRQMLKKIRDKTFDNNEFLKLGKGQVQSLTLNSVKDNKKFDINSVQILYTLPINTFTLINDEDKKVYLAKIKKYKDIELKKDATEFKSYIAKANTSNRNNILKSYDIFLNNKYKIDINQKAINNVKNLFQ
jgi:peptidyl-prolyl cis-trans isomerase D